MRELYNFLPPEKVLFMDIRSSEMTKYAANAMLATRISFMNEVAAVCERFGADVEKVRLGMGSDSRIGYAFLNAGCGYGGSCFPKDVRALKEFSRMEGHEMQILKAVEDVNERQKHVLFEKLERHFGSLKGKTIGIWGLSFKPKTSDVREAPAQALILDLAAAGAKVQAHDPKAIDETREALGELQGVIYVSNQYDAVNGADALVLVTEWDICQRAPRLPADQVASHLPGHIRRTQPVFSGGDEATGILLFLNRKTGCYHPLSWRIRDTGRKKRAEKTCAPFCSHAFLRPLCRSRRGQDIQRVIHSEHKWQKTAFAHCFLHKTGSGGTQA